MESTLKFNLDAETVKAICLHLDPFKKWEEQSADLQNELLRLGLKELYLEDPFKLTNILLKSLHGTINPPRSSQPLH